MYRSTYCPTVILHTPFCPLKLSPQSFHYGENWPLHARTGLSFYCNALHWMPHGPWLLSITQWLYSILIHPILSLIFKLSFIWNIGTGYCKYHHKQNINVLLCVTIQIFFLNLQKWLSDQERWDKGVTTHRFSEAIKAETLHIRPLSTFILAQLCGVFPPRLKLLDPHNYYTL